MIIGLNLDKQRIGPYPGGRAQCQICDSEIIAHCGDIYAWHWQHKQDRDCDPWKEHETEWHRTWKNRFPKEWQETVIINDYGEKHLADVKTKNGLVIEFQNSSISTSTIEIREEFYENMIWVLNANDFKNNIKMWSSVSSGLRRIDKQVIERVIEIEDELNSEIKALDEEIGKMERVRASKFNDLKHHKNELESLACHKNDIDKLTENVIEYWNPTVHNFPNFFVQRLVSDLQPQFKQNFLFILSGIADLNKQSEQVLLKKAAINARANLEYEGMIFKIIDYTELGKHNYHKAICIKKDTIDTLFKKIERISSGLELVRLKYKESEYVIAIDPTDAYNTIEMKSELIKNEMQQKEASYDNAIASIRQGLSDLLDSKIVEVKKVIETEGEKDEDLLFQISELRIQFETKKMRKPQLLETAEKYLKGEMNGERFEIMRKKKGLYSFEWKHERTTWRFASMPIYFDLGDGFLFKKLPDNAFQKYSIEDFVEAHRN